MAFVPAENILERQKAMQQEMLAQGIGQGLQNFANAYTTAQDRQRAMQQKQAEQQALEQRALEREQRGYDQARGLRMLDIETAKTNKEADREFNATQRELDRKNQRDIAGIKATTTAEGKQPSQSEFAAAGFADRVSQANSVLSDPGVISAGLSPSEKAKESIPLVGNFLTSDTRQQYDQAARNFINATLRRESGASISPSEFKSANKQYLPQPGDSEIKLAQKAQNRATILNSLQREGKRVFAQNPQMQTQQSQPKNKLTPEQRQQLINDLSK